MQFSPLRALGQGLVIILICAVSAEVSLRIFNTFVPTFIFYDDSYERYRGRSGESDWGFPLNSLGFKDTEWGDALDDVYRIAGIGDSFAYGVVPYEQVYYTRLEDKLNETHRTEVMNFGIAGIGPADYRDLFMREVLPLEPDMVVVSVYLGNDLDEARVREWWSYSYLTTLGTFITKVPLVQGGPAHQGVYCDECANFPEETYLSIVAEISKHLRARHPALAGAADRVGFYVGDIADVCARFEIDMTVLIIPSEAQVDNSLLASVRAKHFPSLGDEAFEILRPNRAVGEILSSRGIDVLDVTEAFQADAQRLYRPRDTHWNIAGNELGAELLRQHILERFDLSAWELGAN